MCSKSNLYLVVLSSYPALESFGMADGKSVEVCRKTLLLTILNVRLLQKIGLCFFKGRLTRVRYLELEGFTLIRIYTLTIS